MKPAVALLGLILLLDTTFAAEKSCAGRCGFFDPQSKCQCDSMCVYYGSCCEDFDAVCPKKVARGDTFEEGEDVTVTAPTPATTVAPTFNTTASLPFSTTPGPTPADPDAASCSGRPFDAFLQLKNGSTYAFRGEYFFELDDKSILPGYPKLIQDVWGIEGPIGMCVTTEENPLWDKYYKYEFKHQPSHEECVRMSRSSPSMLFTRYTDLFCDQSWEDLFTELFGSSFSSRDTGPRLISRDWQGIRPPVDAAMVGRVYLSPKPTPSSPPPTRRRGSQRRRPSKRRGQRGRQSRSLIFDDLWGFDDWFDYSDYSTITDESATPEYKSTPVQNVYFFKRDKYYRVNLQAKRVDTVNPPYPRSIAKYWLGCKQEATPDESRAEKR
ncbi:vitronectin-like isoform X2 [Lates japonicus]|uniref:Vitronectin-like isoform X2 n=1 Tax=Lates japonicus TaxID=270547 RepID=A0AAD3M2Y6_LATJO|nr:vitronectin-like isoform X2 [Lates japonicus]